MSNKNNFNVSLFSAVAVCSLAALFYFYEFMLQVAPSVMTEQLTQALKIGGSSLGIISGIYYYAYAPMQIPAGLLYDRFGVRHLLCAATLICATGAFLFLLTTHIQLVMAGRILMGFGSAFAYIGTLILISRWFPTNYFALLVGIVQFLGAFGAICGQSIIAYAIKYGGWHNTLFFLAFIGLILAFLIYIIVRDYPSKSNFPLSKKIKTTNALKRLQYVCRNKQVWLIAIYSFMVWAPIAAFAALWGVPFLKQVYNFSVKESASLTAVIWLGAGLGGPILGFLSDHFKKRYPLMLVSALLGFASLLIIIYIPHLSFYLIIAALLCLGLAGAGQSLVYAVINESTDHNARGTAIGFNNMAVVMGGAILQPLIGLILHWYGSANSIGITHVYSTSEYQQALIILPLCYLLAALICLKLTRKTDLIENQTNLVTDPTKINIIVTN